MLGDVLLDPIQVRQEGPGVDHVGMQGPSRVGVAGCRAWWLRLGGRRVAGARSEWIKDLPQLGQEQLAEGIQGFEFAQAGRVPGSGRC